MRTYSNNRNILAVIVAFAFISLGYFIGEVVVRPVTAAASSCEIASTDHGSAKEELYVVGCSGIL